MNFLPALCPVFLASCANRAIWVFGEMRPQVMLRELPLYVLVDFLHVGRVRDATELSARLLHRPGLRYPNSQLIREVLLIYLRRCLPAPVAAKSLLLLLLDCHFLRQRRQDK